MRTISRKPDPKLSIRNGSLASLMVKDAFQYLFTGLTWRDALEVGIIQPTFQVSQHKDHELVLYQLRDFFECGKVRDKGSGSPVKVYVVHSTIQLIERVIPFFEQHELRVKHDDFEKFADIVRSTRSREHHRAEEFNRLVKLAYAMNARGKQRKRSIEEILLGSSETVREVPLTDQR